MLFFGLSIYQAHFRDAFALFATLSTWCGQGKLSFFVQTRASFDVQERARDKARFDIGTQSSKIHVEI